MTDAKPLLLEVVVDCRDGCAAWLARSLGLEAFCNPATAAIGLLLGGGLNRKRAEVARVLIWLDRALPLECHLTDYESGEGRAMYIRPDENANWYEVETAPPNDEDIQVHREVAALERDVNERLRKVANEWGSLEERLVRFIEAGMRLDESAIRRVQQGRVVRAVEGPRSTPAGPEERDAAERAVRSWKDQNSRWNAMMIKYAGMHAELGVFRELVQLRRPFQVAPTHPLASLMMPSTKEEWSSVLRVLEKVLFDAGFNDAEIGEMLPDGEPGDPRRRVAARRKRLVASKTAAPNKVE